jgi:uncharacterized protein YuzE
MTDPTPIQTTYDADSDVLYLTSSSAIATRGVEDENGFVWRTGGDGALVGLTVLDYRERWAGDLSVLLRDISTRFAIAPEQALALLAQADAPPPEGPVALSRRAAAGE